MESNYKNRSIGKSNRICPYLGLEEDPATYSSFPSSWNACHRASPPSIVKPSHQQEFCLQPEHKDCPVFKNQGSQRLPKSIRYQSKGLSQKSIKILKIAVVTVFSSLMFLGLLFRQSWMPRLPGWLPFFSQSMQSSTQNIEQLTTISITATKEEKTPVIPSPTLIQPSESATRMAPSPTLMDPTLALDTPIGDEIQFIIHRVAEGESLQIFATQYNTSIEAIRTVNYDLIAPLWVNWLIIIPINTTEVSDLPTFEAHQVEEEDIPIRVLSGKLSVVLEKIMLYNNLDSEHILHRGEWILVPREHSEP